METKAIQEYEARGSELLAHAESICIVDEVTRELAIEFTVNARKAGKVIEKEFRPDIENAHQLHKDLLARLNKLVAPFKEAQRIVDKEISRDYMERERIRREEERKAQEKADAERREQEAQLTEEAEEFIAEGDLDAAEELLDSDVVVNPDIPVTSVKQTVDTGAGSATVKKDIKVEVVNKREVINAVSAGKLPDTLLTIDVGAAKRYAKASGILDDNSKAMPGFRITETAIVSGRVR